jgi:ABC-type bacteriocin/lantibiotic exporter with double-glycine peptidase domain
LERLIQGRTTILITHRPTLLRLCHAVWCVENGTVVKRDPGDSATPSSVIWADAPSAVGPAL